jgi:hypothetical protein
MHFAYLVMHDPYDALDDDRPSPHPSICSKIHLACLVTSSVPVSLVLPSSAEEQGAVGHNSCI